MKTYKDLTEAEQHQFCDAFYLNWPWEKTDLEASYPWGCPWYNFGDEPLLDENIEIAADKYFLSVFDEIKSLNDQEEKD